ncbi:hypothetical protein [Methylobacterium oxalidis]|uniref:hypothetical protein n=1 Tax=Methylobacterium oxalidis TaxID=944322 RepID=UPI003315339E
MTQLALPHPSSLQPDLHMAENPWLTLWRTFWLDLPLACAGEIDRLLFRWMEPLATTGSTIADQLADDGPPASASLFDEPSRPAEAVTMGLGCGDYSEEVLG